MPDIDLRFGKDMLVLSAPLDAALARQGVDLSVDRQYLNLMEPDSIRDALRFEVMAGAQCVVTSTEDITRARLAHIRMDSDAAKLAQAAVKVANEVSPQHVLAEIGPCGLPLDASSKASLNENRAQYADAARAFGDDGLDAFILNGFFSLADLKCALMGVAQVSGKPVFASVTLGTEEELAATRPYPSKAEQADSASLGESAFLQGLEPVDLSHESTAVSFSQKALDPALWPEAIDAMADLGASVVGFECAGTIARAVNFATIAAGRTNLPLLAQLRVSKEAASDASRALAAPEEIDDFAVDTMERAAVRLYGAHVQFLRATGMATPAYTGALAATVRGLDVLTR